MAPRSIEERCGCLLLDVSVQLALGVIVLEAIFRASEGDRVGADVGRTNHHL